MGKTRKVENMRITYRHLRKMLNSLSEDQLDCDVTVEIPGEETYAADFRIVGAENDTGLEENHPVIFCSFSAEDHRSTEKEVDEYIVSWADPNAKVGD